MQGGKKPIITNIKGLAKRVMQDGKDLASHENKDNITNINTNKDKSKNTNTNTFTNTSTNTCLQYVNSERIKNFDPETLVQEQQQERGGGREREKVGKKGNYIQSYEPSKEHEYSHTRGYGGEYDDYGSFTYRSRSQLSIKKNVENVNVQPVENENEKVKVKVVEENESRLSGNKKPKHKIQTHTENKSIDINTNNKDKDKDKDKSNNDGWLSDTWNDRPSKEFTDPSPRLPENKTFKDDYYNNTSTQKNQRSYSQNKNIHNTSRDDEYTRKLPSSTSVYKTEYHNKDEDYYKYYADNHRRDKYVEYRNEHYEDRYYNHTMDERNRDYRARSSNDKKSQRDVLYPPRSSLPLPPQPASSSSSHYPRREYSEKQYNSTRANRDYDKNHKGYYDGRYDTYERYDRYDKSERYDNVNINTNKHEKSTRYAGYDEHYKYDNYKDYDDYASPTSWNTGSNSTNRVSRTENTHRYSLRSSSGFDSSHQYTKYTDSTAKSYYHNKSQKPPSRPYHKRFDDYDNNDNSNDRNNHNDINNNNNNGYYGQSSSDRYAKVDGYSGEYSSSNRYNDSGSSYKNTTRYEGYESRMKKKHGKYYDYYNERDRKDADTNIVSNSNYNSNSTFTSDAAAAFDKWGKVDEIDNYTNVNENESENDSKGFNYNAKEQQKRQGNLSVEYIPNYNNYSVVKQPEDKKYLLVLDLNGTLVHRSKKSKRITKRPYLDEFLSFALQNFAVMVWSSAQPMNVAKMVRSIFNENQQQIEQLAAIWDRRYCHFIRPKSTTPITNYSPYDTSPIDSDTQGVTPSVVDFNLDDVIPATLENEGLLFGQYFMKSKTIKDLESIWNGFDLSQSAFKSLYKNTHYYYSHPQDDNLNFTTTRIPSSNSNSNGKREWNSKWNSSNTLLLDDSPGKASKQPNNHLCVSTFDNVYQDSDDTLLRVIDYLTEFLRNGGGKNSTKNQESEGSGTKISPSNISEYIYSFPFSQ